jgi:hypothetical protein
MTTPSSSATPVPPPRRAVVPPRLPARNKGRKLADAAARAAVVASGYSGTQTASHFVPIPSGSRTVYHETKVEIPAPVQPIPSVSLPPVPGLVYLPDDEYARLAENHGGVPFVVREPADNNEDDADDDDDDETPRPSGKVSRITSSCAVHSLT